MDRRMDRWMVQAVDMCFYARKEVRKYVLSEDAFLEIEKVVRGHPSFWVFSSVYNLQSFDILPQRTFESSQRRSRRWEATQQDCVWRLSACGEAGLRGEPQIVAEGVLICSSVLSAQVLLCKHSSSGLWEVFQKFSPSQQHILLASCYRYSGLEGKRIGSAQ